MATAAATISVAVIKQPQYLGSGAVAANRVSMGDLKNVYGGNTNPKISEYYSGGNFVPKPPPISASQNGVIPENGDISLGKFLGTTNEYLNRIEYPIISRAGNWRLYLPKLPSGWPSAKLAGRLIGGGGGGGGGWGNGAPNHTTPAAAGGGGGSGTDMDLTTLNTNLNSNQMTKFDQVTASEASYFDLVIGGGGGRSWSTGDWNDGRDTSQHPGGTGGYSYLNLYNRSTGQRSSIAASSGGSGGAGGTYGWSNAGYTQGGGPNGGNGGAGRGAWFTGGNGGGNSLGSGGAGGYATDWGGTATIPGTGGGGGGARAISSDAGDGAPGGDGAAGYGRIILLKGT